MILLQQQLVDAKPNEELRMKSKQTNVFSFLIRSFTISLFSIFFFFSFSTKALAICPVCTIAVGGGLLLSRFFGIDDLIMSIWIGGVILSTALTFGEFIKKKTKLSSVVSNLVSVLISYVILIITLEMTHTTGLSFNTLWGIDKIVLGIIWGSFMFFVGARIHYYIKNRNNGKVIFPFQKVVIPVGLLWIATVIAYVIIYI